MRIVFGFIFAVALFSPLAFATTKGLSQIVTPDLQKSGELSISYQQQDQVIGNPQQIQAELGLTSWLEGAVFKGFTPSEYIFGTEFGLIQKEPYLLSAGFVNLSTLNGKMQPFIESGYYTEHNKFILGDIYANAETELILGWAYDFDSHWRAQLDFQSGTSNFSTVGFTYTLNDSFQFNPALYLSNDQDRRLAGYIVFTYTVALWKTTKAQGAPKAL